MGRPRTINKKLPIRLHQKGRSFYHVIAAKWTPLGRDYAAALREWARIEGRTPEAAGTFSQAAAEWCKTELAKLAAKTQKEYQRAIDRRLVPVFGLTPLDQIKPRHIFQYLTKRSSAVAANREIAVLSAIFNWSRASGLTDASNPCAGIRRNVETGRDRYITDAEFRCLMTHAGRQDLRDAMLLAYYSGQRPGDVLRMEWAHIRDGALWVQQKKTGAFLRIDIVGELAEVIEEIRKRPVMGRAIVVSAAGRPVAYNTLNDLYTAARRRAAAELPAIKTIQFRDIRGKAATDLDDPTAAKALLGHTTMAMTEQYIKQRAGSLVQPVRRKIR
jgi:integrase